MACLLVMTLGGRSRSDTTLAGARDWFSQPLVLTALLGLVWNAGAFVAYGFPLAETGVVGPGLLALAFTALGFLPAVVVDSVLAPAQQAYERGPSLTRIAAYVLSGVAGVLQIQAFLTGQVLPSRLALTILTVGFATLLAPLLIVTRRTREGRTLWIVALSVFAVSALHFTQHTGRDAWWMEALGHHGSLLLALAILHRDYRFAFADMFLKRAVSLTTIVVLVVVTHVMVGVTWPGALWASDASLMAYLVALTVMIALVEPHIRRASTWFVDRVVLRRVDYADALGALEAELATISDERLVAERAGARLGAAVDATTIQVVDLSSSDGVGDVARSPISGRYDDPGAGTRNPRMPLVVRIPTVDGPRLAWHFEALGGGRRLLSDELGLLTSSAASTGRRIDALRVARERMLSAVREQEMGRLASEAELRALRAQINPHFLFNALTTIGYLVRESPQRAVDTLMRLTSLLRAVLHRSRSELTTLGDEIDLVQDYLQIEQARFEERLQVTIDVPASLRGARIPTLLIQPLVENAVKHGITPLAAGGHVTVEASHGTDDRGQCLRIVVRDTGAGATPLALSQGRRSGVGLSNVEHRLHGLFGDRARIAIDGAPGCGTTVALVLPLDTTVKSPLLPETVNAP